MANRYQCSNQPLYQEWIVDSDGKFNVMFACHDLINSVVHEGGTVARRWNLQNCAI